MATISKTAKRPATDASVIVSFNPANGDYIGSFPVTPAEQLPAMLARARTAQQAWERGGLPHRLALVQSLQDSMYRNLDLIIDTLVAEVGKPRMESLVEFFPTIELIAYQRREAPRVLRGREVFTFLVPHRRHRVEYRPYGVVAVIAPWNFPLILSMAPIVSALIAGNAVIYKPSEFSPKTGEVITRVIHEAGIPPDLVQTVYGYGDLGAALVKARPDKICFTGSVATGRKVAAAAGEMLIPVTLELGGKDAAIVLRDADLERTAVGLTWAGMVNAGQACLSIERIYVERPVADELVERMKDVVQTHVQNASGDISQTLGAITNDAQLRIIEGQVNEAVAQGARVVCGGARRPGPGRFYEPTILTDVSPDMRVMTDETFGPVFVVVPVDNADEALRMANDTRFGLTGSVWTRDHARGLELARQMRVGHAGVNDHIMSASIPNLPWGGVGDSGYGRERGQEGVLDMVYVQALSSPRLTLKREFFWYPYTPRKYGLLRRLLTLLYGPTWGDRLRALLP